MIEMKNWKRSVAFLTLALVVGLLCGGLAWAAKPPKPPPPPPPPTVSYSLVMLGTLGEGAQSGAQDMNNFGDVVGWSHTTTAGGRHAFLYTAESGMQDLNVVAGSVLPSGWVLDIAYGINDLGQIVGNSGSRGFRYTPAGNQAAEFLDLEALGMRVARAINDFGDVAGTCIDAEGRERVCLFTDEDGLIQLPLTSDGRLWRPQAINNDGQIVGYTTTVRNEAVRYTPGVGVELLGFLKLIVSPYSNGTDINDAGQVAGYSAPRRSVTHAFRYTDGVGMKDLGTLGGTNSWATGINSDGDVVGHAQTAAGAEPIFLYTNETGMINVTAAIVNPFVGFDPGAGRVNDNGLICGTGEYADGTQEANLLTPVP